MNVPGIPTEIHAMLYMRFHVVFQRTSIHPVFQDTGSLYKQVPLIRHTSELYFVPRALTARNGNGRGEPNEVPLRKTVRNMEPSSNSKEMRN